MNRVVGSKFHSTFAKRKEGIVFPPADKESRFETCPSLPNDDLSRPNPLPSEAFDPEALRVGFAAVLCTALSLDVCHVLY